jgi:hypothetical protein
MLVEDPEEMHSGLEPVLAHNGAAVIDALVEPKVPAPPPKVTMGGWPNTHRGLAGNSLPHPSHPGPDIRLTGRGAGQLHECRCTPYCGRCHTPASVSPRP